MGYKLHNILYYKPRKWVGVGVGLSLSFEYSSPSPSHILNELNYFAQTHFVE